MIAGLVREGAAQLRETGVRRDQVQVEVAVDVRHRGQGDAVTVELGGEVAREDPAGQVERGFEEAYVRLYGRRPPGVEAEVMTWRARVLGPLPELDVRRRRRRSSGDATKGSRSVWFAETGPVPTPVLDRYRLGPGTPIEGPAVIEERESTVVLGPGASASVDPVGNLVAVLP